MFVILAYLVNEGYAQFVGKITWLLYYFSDTFSAAFSKLHEI